MPSRKELYADLQNYRAVQIEAAMNGKQPPSKAEWMAQQSQSAEMDKKKKKS